MTTAKCTTIFSSLQFQ